MEKKMGVTLEINTSLLELMVQLGCDPSLIQEAEDAHLSVNYQLSGVAITTTAQSPVKEAGEVHTALAPIKLAALQSILSGKLPGGAAKNLARISLEKSLKQVLLHCEMQNQDAKMQNQVIMPLTALEQLLPEALAQHDTSDASVDSLEDQLKEELKLNKPIESVFKKSSTPVSTEEIMMDPEKALGQKVNLNEATVLYQPVRGTDASSTYYTVALSTAINVAIRAKIGGKLSIRASGPMVETNKAAVVGSGLTVNVNGSYASVHLSCANEALAKKAVGSVLFALGVQFQKMACDLSPIWGKGQ